MPKLKLAKEKSLKAGKTQIFQSVKGMNDILPKDQDWWKMIIRVGESVSELNDFYFIETPILEPADLFEVGVGAVTDIIEKQMYVFRTKGGERVALRPEGTAPVMRSYLEHHLGYFMTPLKVYYYGPMFRYERPQAGRERQFHHWGFEIIGDSDPVYDVQVMLASINFLTALKIKNLKLKINTIGCRICRPNYRQRLKDYYRSYKENLCKDCKIRYEKNPLRLLDCKEKECEKFKEKAPIILDYLCQNCNNHFKGVLELVEDNNIPYEPDPYLVRGLDYYNRTVFEFFATGEAEKLGALGGGGRYDYLSELLGGRLIPATGAALGIERIIETMRAQNLTPFPKSKSKVFFIAVGEAAKKSAVKLINQLRLSGIVVAEALGKKSLKAQLKAADKIGAPLALIFGQKEAFEESVIVRDMTSGAQEVVMFDKMIEVVKKKLK
jgi:histidyl-tRNA synthetase